MIIVFLGLMNCGLGMLDCVEPASDEWLLLACMGEENWPQTPALVVLPELVYPPPLLGAPPFRLIVLLPGM